MNTPPDWLLELTFCVEYCPNCPSRWLMRLPGYHRGVIDKKPAGESTDAMGYGKSLVEAANNARAALETQKAAAKHAHAPR